MEQILKEITINGSDYVLKSSISSNKEIIDINGLKCVLCRTYSAGVHVGYLKERNGKEVTLLNARRIYYWEGAATLSQLAMEGVSKPQNCKFPQEVNEILLTEVIEIIPITEKAKKSIDSVKIWKE